MAGDENWGYRVEPARRRGGAARVAGVAGQGNERVLAAAAHAAIGFGLLGIGFLLSLAITGVIWLVGRRSPFVQAHADRSGRYQIFVLLVNILVGALLAIALALFLVYGRWDARGWRLAFQVVDGLLLLVAAPVFLAWYFGTIFYGLYAAVRVLGGHDFHYPPPPWRRRRPLDRPLRGER
ncbi:MAG: DUF4870 domain-containing protein [Chloroflexota bacterium]|nr:DUF4870 domain-containing protein [Chloroflexota bacterium]